MVVCTAIWMMLDLLWLLAGAWLAHVCTSDSTASWNDWETMLAGAGAPLLLLCLALAGVYARKHLRTPVAAIARIALVAILAWAVANRAMVAMHMHRPHYFAWLDAWLFISLGSMIATRAICGRWLRRIDRNRPHLRRVVLAGDAAYLSRWLQTRRTNSDEYAITAAFLPDREQIGVDIPALKNFEDLVAKAKDQEFDELWLALPMSGQEEISCYITALQHHFVDIRLFADVQRLPLFNPSATTLGGTTFIDLVTSPSSQDDAWSKWLFDRLFALLVLLVLSPVLATIAIMVKCTSHGPVLFRQRRKGVDGREFTILKFRSMSVHREVEGRLTQASKNDKRVTRVGRILRKTSLDELPQFINVLLGQMSVVGPRPHALEHDDFYMRLIDGYMYRYRIKPGITGWAQVNGARGETAKVESMARRVTLDLFYIQHWSFWLDLKIVAMTIFKGFVGRNAY